MRPRLNQKCLCEKTASTRNTEVLAGWIRQARYPDDPQLIDHWLVQSGSDQGSFTPNSDKSSSDKGEAERNGPDSQSDTADDKNAGVSEARWAVHEAQFYLLLEVVADELLPAQWRRTCLARIHLPLSFLTRLACNSRQRERIRFLYYELYVTSQWVRASL